MTFGLFPTGKPQLPIPHAEEDRCPSLLRIAQHRDGVSFLGMWIYGGLWWTAMYVVDGGCDASSAPRTEEISFPCSVLLLLVPSGCDPCFSNTHPEPLSSADASPPSVTFFCGFLMWGEFAFAICELLGARYVALLLGVGHRKWGLTLCWV